MSIDYAAGLSQYDDLGICGINEIIEEQATVSEKLNLLADWLRQSKKCVVHVGAGLSTSAGIPDFRGPNGIWTLQQKNQVDGIKQEQGGVSFDTAQPTFAHRALKVLLNENLVNHVISQNVDGLFLRCGIPRKQLSELHGNFYLDECTLCKNRFIRSSPSSTMGLKKSNIKCPRDLCRGSLRDTILDWENSIPHNELRIATREAKTSDLHICMGSSMQLMPANQLPLNVKRKKNGKLVIINLQPTKMDDKADLVIHDYLDACMERLMMALKLEVPTYQESQDPTRSSAMIGEMWTRQQTRMEKDDGTNRKSTPSIANPIETKLKEKLLGLVFTLVCIFPHLCFTTCGPKEKAILTPQQKAKILYDYFLAKEDYHTLSVIHKYKLRDREFDFALPSHRALKYWKEEFLNSGDLRYIGEEPEPGELMYPRYIMEEPEGEELKYLHI